MESTLVNWLGTIGRAAFAWSLGLFLVINGVALVAFLLKRDRAMVNRWTGRVLAMDLLLLGTGVGIPAVTTMTRLTVSAVTTAFGGSGLSRSASATSTLELEPTGK